MAGRQALQMAVLPSMIGEMLGEARHAFRILVLRFCHRLLHAWFLQSHCLGYWLSPVLRLVAAFVCARIRFPRYSVWQVAGRTSWEFRGPRIQARAGYGCRTSRRD